MNVCLCVRVCVCVPLRLTFFPIPQECVGQPLYLLVCALTEQISKGPVDSVTGKALYTLSEDWLLSQAPDFSPLVTQTHH